ncbi:cell surface protein precursor [Lactiplantibacillus fabifermentans DSM 21115]|uniref:Cell surface protein n=2 Tax=Lactiplantibacillus fabifermentans TaxID=483011 RepID=A0A0R2NKG4_9LACO|nr:cell surface protein precursor [Lactiplantibacillus fabifermentans DSM 21115]
MLIFMACFFGIVINQPVPGHATAISSANTTTMTVADQSQFIDTAIKLNTADYLATYSQQHGPAATVAMTQAWLQTYRLMALTGINLLNTEFTGSVATFSGGLTSTNGRATIQNGTDSTWGSIINGGVAIENNHLIFDQVNLLTDQLLENQAMDYQNPRPTGNGAIDGLETGQQTQAETLSPIAIQQAMQAIADYYNGMIAGQTAFDVAGAYGNFNKTMIGQAGTLDAGVADGKHYYIVNIDASHLPNLQTTGFDDNDVLIYNDVSKSDTVTLSGGFTANGGQIIWNFPTATKINNTTKITGRILAPNGILLTNQNVDGANVMQYGSGYSNSAHAAIVAKPKMTYPVGETIKDDPLSYLQLIVTSAGKVVQPRMIFKSCMPMAS